MSSNLGDLPITTEELETLVDIDISTGLAIDVYRGLILRNGRQMLSVLLTEVFTFILILIFVIPISLIVLRNSGNLPDDLPGKMRLLTILVGISLLGLLVWNAYLWKQAQQIKFLAKLMDEIDKYNSVIKAIELVDKLESVSHSGTKSNNLSNRQEVLDALIVTKEGLINALRVEKIIRSHHDFIANKYELFTDLENNLTVLMSFDTTNSANDYGQLMNEALKIGLTVHKEIRNLRKS
ncbi:hypothetical protein [Limnofasciculus baicalensis]|uniref:Uncharacterized protein n=1 Tax=Limnofasciculus baicalensis BBK-W-15 TaxID=2699891 RepID=A0AAE3GU97_9CYAN|nr:hypothetical protein [Limnofasciculus baicalensis]MCP2730182.1 hypothetical protein [Limnofasciculus baicalensis BBK-W-15]